MVGADHQRRCHSLEHRLLLGRGEARVDPGADGADLRACRVGHDVIGRGRQAQAHDVALADPGLGQAHRHFVGESVEVAIGQ